MLFRQPNTVSLLLDLSLQRFGNKRLLDIVKKSLIEFVRNFGDDDVFYLYLPDAVDTQLNRGQRVAAIANYETDGLRFDLISALKQTLYIAAAGDPDGQRTMVMLTDRLNEAGITALSRVVMINERDSFDLNVVVIGIGSNYDQKALGVLQFPGVKVFHTDEPSQIHKLLSYLIPEEDARTIRTPSEPEAT